jgi:hypothetical protein
LIQKVGQTNQANLNIGADNLKSVRRKLHVVYTSRHYSPHLLYFIHVKPLQTKPTFKWEPHSYQKYDFRKSTHKKTNNKSHNRREHPPNRQRDLVYTHHRDNSYHNTKTESSLRYGKSWRWPAQVKTCWFKSPFIILVIIIIILYNNKTLLCRITYTYI